MSAELSEPEQKKLTENGGSFQEAAQKLPTTLELARKGVDAYQKVLSHIDGRDFLAIGRPLILNLDLRSCFVGVTAHFRVEQEVFDEYSDEKQPDFFKEKLAPLIQEHAPSILVIPGKTGKTSKKEADILNLDTVKRIATLYPDFFPDQAREEPAKWAVEWLAEGRGEQKASKTLYDIRMGLLSGYPLGSVLKFPDYRSAIRKVGEQDGGFLRHLIQAFEFPNNDAAPRGIRGEAVEKLGDALTEKERRAILIARKFGEPLEGGVSLEGEKDEFYEAELRKIMKESGINEVTKVQWERVGKLVRREQRELLSILKHCLWLARNGRWSTIPWSIRHTLRNEQDYQKSRQKVFG